MDESLLKDRCVAITGILDTMTREQAIIRLVEAGAKPMDIVHKTSDLLVVGRRPCWKIRHAHEHGVPTIGEDDFLALLRTE
jgi:DNA ligase (NAD+)